MFWEPRRLAPSSYHSDVLRDAPQDFVCSHTRKPPMDFAFTRLERVMKINGLGAIADDAVEAARSMLAIGIS